MYIVIKDFKDLKTGHIYREGDIFPFEGKASKGRLSELSTNKNKRNEPVIREVDDNVSNTDT